LAGDLAATIAVPSRETTFLESIGEVLLGGSERPALAPEGVNPWFHERPRMAQWLLKRSSESDKIVFRTAPVDMFVVAKAPASSTSSRDEAP